MSNEEKGRLFRELKQAGIQFKKHYRDYTVVELQEAVNALAAGRPKQSEPPETPEAGVREPRTPQPSSPPVARARTAPASVPQRPKDPAEMAGQRLNTREEDEPIRVDPDTGFIWYQEEVQKPAFPKPRGRRVLTYIETGVKQVKEQQGDYLETFEVAGDQAPRTAEVKVTLPSFQVGCYKDPRFPFKIHIYNGNTGFDLFDVQSFYGGAVLVPEEVKRIYVENVLCYDIRSVVREINAEARRLTLAGKM